MIVPQVQKEIHGYILASKTTRLLASLAEGIIFGVLSVIIFYVLGTSNEEETVKTQISLLDIAYSAGIGFIVGAIFYPLFGGNLGHKIFGLKVIHEETGKDYNKLLQGAIREALKRISAYLVIPVIWILWDEYHQNLYDKVTRTCVVERTPIQD